MVEFTDLPVELVIYIFQYLNLKDLKVCGATCSWFQQIIFNQQPTFIRPIADLPDEIRQGGKLYASVRVKALLDIINNHLLGEEAQLLIVEIIGNLSNIYNRAELLGLFLKNNIMSAPVQTLLFQLFDNPEKYVFRQIVCQLISNQRLTESSTDILIRILSNCNDKDLNITYLIEKQLLNSTQQIKIVKLICLETYRPHCFLINMFRRQKIDYETQVGIFRMLRSHGFYKVYRTYILTSILCLSNINKLEIIKAYKQSKIN